MNQTSQNNRTNENKKETFVTVYISDILKGLRRFWWVCVAAAILAGGYRGITEKLNFVPQYTSSVTLTVNTQYQTSAVKGISVYSYYYDSTTASVLAKTFPAILSCNMLQERICEDLDIPYVPVALSASCPPGSNMFTISATGNNAKSTYDVLVSAIDNYPAVAEYVVGSIEFDVLKPPAVATSPSNEVSFVKEGIKGAIVGVFFGLAFIFAYILQRKTVKTKNDIKTKLNLEPLAVVPQVTFKKRAMATDKSLLFTNPDISSGFPEAFRVLRNVFISSLNENEKIIMATSSVPGEGKTTVVTNLALALADHNKNVLLVDGDIRHPSVLALLGIDSDEIDYETETDLYKIAYLEEFRLRVLMPAAKDENSSGYFSSANIGNMFAELRNSYDYILVDTPPCGLISDALFIAQHADAAIFVMYQDAVRISRIRNTMDSLMTTDIRILGAVLNGTAQGISGYGYGYGYGGYGYGYGYGKYGYGKYGYGYGKYGYGYGEKKHSKNKKQKETKK